MHATGLLLIHLAGRFELTLQERLVFGCICMLSLATALRPCSVNSYALTIRMPTRQGGPALHNVVESPAEVHLVLHLAQYVSPRRDQSDVVPESSKSKPSPM